MQELRNTFITKSFLRSVWALDYEAFKGSHEEERLLTRLERWAARKDLKETSSEAAFIEEFFRDTWGYVQSGQTGSEQNFTLWPKFHVPGAGPRGGPGEADLAIGYFIQDSATMVPQVLCEFKDIKSDLDAPQKRKGDNRSPVRQGLDYLSHARRGMFGNEPVLPTWAIVTDMNEFRLYWFDRGHHQYVRFTLRPTTLFQGPSLLAKTEEARFDRFLFNKLFHKDTLLTTGARPLLAQLIAQQWVRERELENTFYAEYKQFREHLYLALLESNGEGTPQFPGTKGRLVRFAQKILDRCIFIFFCEDMGKAIGFPPQLLRDFLIHESKDPYFDPQGQTIWQRLLRLFRAMNDGTAFGGETLNQFNGGLFAIDQEMERLNVPNRVFCQPGQGQNEAGLYAHKLTLLYFSASYNFASGWAEGLTKPPLTDLTEADSAARQTTGDVGLYMLGRIFEQSITELEILEAEADGRPSLNKESKRKRDGVYYTPEWVVERVVGETLGPRLAELKREFGWPEEGDDALPSKQAIDAYAARLKTVTLLDPACGSGAFLITALRYLIEEWHSLQGLRREVTRDFTTRDDEDALIRDILRSNLYGVDINPASVEITQLALWLHTARGDKPLSSLDATVRDGNSLVDNNFYKGQIDLSFYDQTQKERVNAFDWSTQFPQVFERGGFDVVVGNPPYVKLQNFRTVHSDVAEFLKVGRPSVHFRGYGSAQTGNFDLYLPFIEKGLSLLNDHGRLGYIAPSLWTVSEYGEGLRRLIDKGRNLEGWIDFKAFQVFDEATNYTALQFFTKRPNDTIKIASAPDGTIPERPWDQAESTLRYGQQTFGERWLLLTGRERALIDRLYEECRRLDDPGFTTQIYQGLITSADAIYHLRRLGPGRYLCNPKDNDTEQPYEVEIEDTIMKPLVSGAEAKRYVEPKTDTYLLFPYRSSREGVELLSHREMFKYYLKAWTYLRSYESVLRLREVKKNHKGEVIETPFDDEQWYRFGRNQSLDKQNIAKLIVAQTVPRLRVCFDAKSAMYLNNVRVNGIISAGNTDPWFLLGILNAPIADFVFRRIAKVKARAFYEANKQFIAPLPIPKASRAEQASVSIQARKLQAAHTRRRDVLEELEKRLSTVRTRNRPVTWLFPTLRSLEELAQNAPPKLDDEARKLWAQKEFNQALTACYDAITSRLQPTSYLAASFSAGELCFSVDGMPVIYRIFVSEQEGNFVAAQWKVIASTFSISERTDGKKLCNTLRKLAATDNTALMDQITKLENELAILDADIDREEAELNSITYKLYGLTEAEIAMVERG